MITLYSEITYRDTLRLNESKEHKHINIQMSAKFSNRSDKTREASHTIQYNVN